MHCNKRFVQRRNLFRHIKCQRPLNVTDEKLEYQLCHAKFKRRDNLTSYTRTCEFHASVKRPAKGQIGGRSKPKTKRMDILEGKSQALDHTTCKFTTNLEQLDQTPKIIIDIFKNYLLDLKPTIEEALERKRAFKVVIALHATFYQAMDPTFMTEPYPVFKSSPLEILLATDIDKVLHTMTEQILKKVDKCEERGTGWVLHQLLRLDLHTLYIIIISIETGAKQQLSTPIRVCFP